MSVDSGMLVVVTIVAMYMTLVFILLFYVKNEWCDILHYNLTVSTQPLQTLVVTRDISQLTLIAGWCHFNTLLSV